MAIFSALPAGADNPHELNDVLKNLPEGASHGIVCSGRPYVTTSYDSRCYTPIGVGKIRYVWSDGHFTYAIVEDLNGDDLCFAGPVSDVVAGEKIAPAPGNLDTVLTLGCMRTFGQVEPVPKAAFVLWY